MAAESEALDSRYRGGVVVTDQGEPVGLLTERVISHLMAQGRDLDQPVGTVMTQGVATWRCSDLTTVSLRDLPQAPPIIVLNQHAQWVGHRLPTSAPELL